MRKKLMRWLAAGMALCLTLGGCPCRLRRPAAPGRARF